MPTTPSRKLLVAGITVVATTALIVGAAAAAVQTVVPSRDSATPGSTITISGTSTCPGGTVNLYFAGPPFLILDSTTADAGTGDYSESVTIPADATVEMSRVGAQCTDGSATVYVDFEVVAPTTTTTTTTTAPDSNGTTTTTVAPESPSAPADPGAVEPSALEPGAAAAPRSLSLAG